jgi:CBS domain-containing protein
MDNFVRPDSLSHLERSQLKDAFAVISSMQETLAHRYQTGRFA